MRAGEASAVQELTMKAQKVLQKLELFELSVELQVDQPEMTHRKSEYFVCQ